MRGLTKVEVLNLLSRKKIKNFKLVGSGFVNEQNIKPGSVLKNKKKLVIYFKES